MGSLPATPSERRSDDAVLRVAGLTKVYDATRIVDDVSFDLYPGEILTLLGPSGCGKTTTLRMIAGLEQPDAGEVWVRGRLVASGEKRVMVPPEARNIGLVFQSYAIWPHMTVWENVAYPLRVRRVDRDLIASRASAILRLVKLEGLESRLATDLSGGQQQRVALARALIYEPDLLLLDEPLSNLDTVLRKDMRSQLKSLQSRLNTTFLYVTHDQEEAMSLSTRVAVMNHGRIEQMDEPGRVYEAPATRFVQWFVGRTVGLRGVVDGEDGRNVRIGGGRISASTDGYASGTEVEVTMRPEDISLQTGGAEDNGLFGHVLEVTFFGDRLECLVRIDGPDEQYVTVDVNKQRQILSNTKVFLAVDPDRTRLWPL